MNKLGKRASNYHKISALLSCLSTEALLPVLFKAKPMHKGIGGTSALITLDGTPVFVKQIPLTDIELLPQHFNSTANIFELPLYYQYGVGSTGFGAWRELAAHRMTTDWVLNNEWPHFPLMYHWRILPNDSNEVKMSFWEDIDQYTQYWENSVPIRKRIEALNKATSHITLFLEYVPQNLHEWLKSQIFKDDATAQKAVEFVDTNLRATNHFMKHKGLLHFDAHFENILCDGELLYLSDFGLALSSTFELTQAEKDFMKHHHNYDEACAAVNLLHSIISTLFGKELWEVTLREYIEKPQKQLTPAIDEIIQKYAKTALAMDAFFQQLQKKSKLTPFPATLIEKLLIY